MCVYIYGPREPARSGRAPSIRPDRASIKVDMAVVPWSTMERRSHSKGDRQLAEISSAIRATFEPVLLLHTLPRSEIHIVVHVLQQDGSILPTAINACTLALVDAGIPMKDYVASLSSGLYGATAMLDLNAIEETDLPHLVLAATPRTGKVPLLQLDTRVHVDRCSQMVSLAVEAARVVSNEMDTALRMRTARLVDALNAGAPGSSDGMDQG